MPNLPEILLRRSTAEPETIAYRFFQGAKAPETLTYGALWRQASALAQFFQENGLTHQPALLTCKSQQNFIVAFWACMLAGTIAVPTALQKRQVMVERMRLLARDARARALIVDSDDAQEIAPGPDGVPVLRIDLRTCLDGRAAPASWTPAPMAEDAIAFLQYTSGSTGEPKGVVVSHANLVHNCEVIRAALDISPASVMFFALPLFHDLGLISAVLEGVYTGCVSNIMAPSEFAQYPERWLRAISDYRVTISGGPNFMYDMAARDIKPEQVDGVDLSSWRVAVCGAEPIRAATIERFTDRFGAHGFRLGAFHPCYGMAEATLYVTGKATLGVAPPVRREQGSAVVGCGVPPDDISVRIVDPDTCVALADGAVGEIWVCSGSVARGYWMRPEQSAQTFQAQIVDGDGRRYLRTGDLGYLHEGELYVTARLKDLIIVYGQNYAPQDLEDEAERSHPAVRPGASAAFSVTDAEIERVVLVCELQRTWLRRHAEWPDVIQALRRGLSAACGVNVDDIVLINPATLPRTSSGKVRRAQTRSDYLSGALVRAASSVVSELAALPN